jgi:hypothetical protein
MKRVLIISILMSFGVLSHSQIDTISKNIYQNDGNLGIGISNPETKLRIEGNVSDGDNRAFIRLRNTNTGNRSTVSLTVESNDKSSGAAFGFTSDSYTGISDFNRMGVISTNGKGFSIYSSSNYGSLRFYTNVDQNGIIERMRINAEGNIGIGTKDPHAKLQIADGDIYISNIQKGIIMKSPDGQCWRGVIDNFGRLNFSRINCPDGEIIINPDPLKPPLTVSVFPNPSGDIITLKIEPEVTELLNYSIYSINGQLQGQGEISKSVQTINISLLSSGTFLLKLSDKKGNLIASEMIVKK